MIQRRLGFGISALGLGCLTAMAAAQPGAAPGPVPPPQTISVAVARELAGSGGPIVLDDRDSLEPEAALNLARSTDGISLDGLTSLTPATARALALHGQFSADLPEKLDLGSLLERVGKIAASEDGGPDFAGLEALVTELNGGHSAVGVRTGSPKGPEKGDPWLSLGGLRALEPDVAAALALHEGPLLLDGIESLSDEVAAALAAHSGELSLAGLKSLSPAARSRLASHDGPVVIPDALLGQPNPPRPAPKAAPPTSP
jgi:hypothetical protein